jgi:hypothetical protein
MLLSLPAQGQEGVFVRDFLGKMGIIDDDGPQIEYRERPPLVVPPKMELRQPADATALRANPQWPNDPDVAARAKADADARIPTTFTERRRLQQNPRLSVDELRAGTVAGPERNPVRRVTDGPHDTYLTPDQLRATARPDPDLVVEAGNAPRRNLTDPPAGYRQVAPGARSRAVVEPVKREDESDTRGFLREQARR